MNDLRQHIINTLHPKQEQPVDQRGRTPFHGAAQFGHLELCKLFSESYVNNEQPVDHQGWTPFHVAAASGMDIVKH